MFSNYNSQEVHARFYMQQQAAVSSYQGVDLMHHDVYQYFATSDYGLLDKYCLCIDSNYCMCHSSHQSAVDAILPIKDNASKSKRAARVKSLQFQRSLQSLIEFIDSVADPNEVVFTRNVKKSYRLNASVKRTTYFGVNKNGPNWQTLISINSKKTYVGTFMTELEAAKVFDFYAMLVHWSKAKTNFEYTKADVIDLVQLYAYLL